MSRLRKNKHRGVKAQAQHSAVFDVYEKSARMAPLTRKMTGIVYDDSMLLHKCEWDEKYPENPDRYACVMERYLMKQKH